MDSKLKFAVSAPGKVILNGEHSVVYGKPAIAGTIGLRNVLTLQTNASSSISIKLDILQHTIECDLKDLNSLLALTFPIYKDQNLPSNLNHNDFLDTIKKFVLNTTFHVDFNASDHINTLSALFYILCGILISNKCSKINEGFEITMKSGITTGAGLGSSASYGVCLAGCFYFYAKSRNSPDFINQFNSMAEDEQSAIRAIISDWAFCSEKIMHGNPSGLDNHICTFGGLVKFYRNQKPASIKSVRALNILIIDSCVSRSTAAMVQRVLQQKTEDPSGVQDIFDKIENVVDAVSKILEDPSLPSRFLPLSKLFSENNELLAKLNVSHKELDNIRDICSRYILSAKLTGAGGGGYAIVVLPDDYQHGNAEYFKLFEELTAAGYKVQDTTVGDEGFKVEVVDDK
ncbi:hypothetical protein HA402_004314 [Bradysia odoriphaga]|nr:hypothetical protein HA402_004314 [Bradysia odoriphaga]